MCFFLEGLNVYQPLQGIPTYLVVNERFLGRGERGEVEMLEQPERGNIIDLDLIKRERNCYVMMYSFFSISSLSSWSQKSIFEYL